MNNKQIEFLIAKQLSGELKPEEEKKFRLWLNSNARNREEFNQIALTHQLSSVTSSTDRKKEIFSHLKSRIEGEHIIPIGSWQQQRAVKFRWIAAAVTLVFFSISILYFLSNQKIQSSPLSSEMTKKMNPSGQKSKIFLPDGSLVWLNSESYLLYESNFTDSIRYIEMEGEAYFEVKKDENRPFLVKCKSVTITALGTAFNVNSFEVKDGVHVGLTEGIVSVESTTEEANPSKIIIDPGQGVIYNPNAKSQFSKVDIDPSAIYRWKDGVLQLEGDSFDETIQILSRWYGVEFVIMNQPYREWHASGTFDNENLDNVLRNLGFSQGFDYDIQDKKIYVTFKNKIDAYELN
jgi:ferric-dicitrate binding protein FerR (iron transport regulator)